MHTLDTVCDSTNKIFDLRESGQHLTLPEPPIIWKDRLAALEEASLENHRAALIFDMRCWQAEQLGFQKISSDDLVKILMGEVHTETTTGPDRQVYEYAYNHHTDTDISNTNWGGKPSIFNNVTRKGFWYLPPFAKQIIWSVQFGKLNYLKRTIPYGVVLRINECKSLKLFNCFNVLAPVEAWERDTDIDPIVVATIWEMPPTKDAHSSAGQVAHFFLAKW